jgi:hypothetical protein
MRNMTTAILTFLLMLWSSFASADISGDIDQRYQSALANWLSGDDDLKALKSLAMLANEDNLAAQVTLGMISRRSRTHYETTKNLSKKERYALFRKPNGRFGASWLKVAASSSSLAQLLLFDQVKDYEVHAISLAGEGAISDAIAATRVAANQLNEIGALRALLHPSLQPYTKLEVRWHADLLIRRNVLYGDPKIAKETIELLIGVPEPDLFDRMLRYSSSDIIRRDELPTARKALRLRGAVLLLHPRLEQVKTIITNICPNDTAYNLGLLFYVRSFRLTDALISPLEPIVSTADWQKSDRFQRDFLALSRPSEMQREILRELSQCLFNAYGSKKR